MTQFDLKLTQSEPSLLIFGSWSIFHDYNTSIRLPLDQLKIDQSFVLNIVVKTTDAVIVQTNIGMTNDLGMEVIAEGLETEVKRLFLEQCDCQVNQGYLFSKLLSVEQG